MLIYSKINKDRICFASESTLLLIVSKFEDDPSQNTKYHRSTFTLSVPSALFSGFCIVEHFLYLFFRCSILLEKIFFMRVVDIKRSDDEMIKRLGLK